MNSRNLDIRSVLLGPIVLRFDKRLPDVGEVRPVVTWYGENFSQPYEEGGNDSQEGEGNSKYEERKYGGGRELALL